MSDDYDYSAFEEQLRSIHPDKGLKELDPFVRKWTTGETDQESAENAARSALACWRNSHNAADALDAIWTFMSARIDVPDDLRMWFLECLVLTLNGDGSISMDKAFGLGGDSCNHSAFTVRARRIDKANVSDEIHTLVDQYNLSAAQAARLVFERASYLGNTKFTSAESLRVQYSQLEVKPQRRSPLFDDPLEQFEYEVKYLKSYDVPSLSELDRTALLKLISVVESKL